ncbi:MAG: PD-(D/E)XK nuclease family transposase [Thermoguttaceae bacterium]|nr:PD-(D/E)XK nuclease family transposase [Thermoguttaceae bacterium]
MTDSPNGSERIDAFHDVAFRPVWSQDEARGALKALINAAFVEKKLAPLRRIEYVEPFLAKEAFSDREQDAFINLMVEDADGKEFAVLVQTFSQIAVREEYALLQANLARRFFRAIDVLRSKRRIVALGFVGFPLFADSPELWAGVGRFEWRSSRAASDAFITVEIRVPRPGEIPTGLNTPELIDWVDFLGKFSTATDAELDEFAKRLPETAAIRKIVESFSPKRRAELNRAIARFNARVAKLGDDE